MMPRYSLRSITLNRSMPTASVASEVINEESREIEDAGEPEDHEHDVSCFDPQHAQRRRTRCDLDRNSAIDRCNMLDAVCKTDQPGILV